MTPDNIDSPFHVGEQRIQTRVGTREKSERMGQRMIRSFMPQQHREFFAQLSFLIIGSIGESSQLATSLVEGEPGFISTPTETQIRIQGRRKKGDPLLDNLRVGAKLGLLGIEPHTRRRNRANGVVIELDETSVLIGVEQSFGNCPKYIHPRSLERVASAETLPISERIVRSQQLTTGAQQIIANADTFYVASSSAADETGRKSGLDVSHRGGPIGFVHLEDNTLTVPDYIGNNAFNTLGNFESNPRAGLLFADFTTGDLLHVAGSVELVWDGALLESMPQAQRAWSVHVDTMTLRPSALSLREQTQRET